MLDLVERALALRGAPLFRAFEPRELLPVAELCRERELGAGERLFAEGELGDALFVIVSGRVEVVQGGRVIAELGAGECVGELAALDWEPRSAEVRALEATELVQLERDDLMDLLGEHPQLVRALLAVLAERIRGGSK